MKSRVLAASAVMVLGVAGASTVSASVIFDLEPSTSTSDRPAGWGPGQSVTAEQNVEIGKFSMYFDTPNGANVDFMIYDVTTAKFVFSSVETIAASSTESWQTVDVGQLTLNAGDTYNFGVIANNSMDIGYIHPRYDYTSGFLKAVSTGNSNYTNYSAPNYDCCAHAEIALQLYNWLDLPEPSTWAIMMTGIFGVGGAMRLQRRKPVAA
jgi:hypothetical protein